MSDYVGRHGAPRRRRARTPRATRVPRALRGGYTLPTMAVATLAVTATGAGVAQSSTLTDGLASGRFGFLSTGSSDVLADPAVAEQVRLQLAEAAADRTGVAQRRDAAAISRAAALGRAAASRSRERKEAAAAAAALAKAHMWVMPVHGARITSGFGYRWGRLHAGLDFGAPTGAPLYAMSSGEVIFAGYESGYGYKVEIRYWDGTVSYYGHMSRIIAWVGQQVSPGDQVGNVGSTGHSTGPHLHLEIHPNGGDAIDPAPWLSQHGLVA